MAPIFGPSREPNRLQFEELHQGSKNVMASHSCEIDEIIDARFPIDSREKDALPMVQTKPADFVIRDGDHRPLHTKTVRAGS